MSKQHLTDMLKSIANNDLDSAKAHFANYATEKTTEILARGDATDDNTPPAEPVEIEA